MNSFRHVAGLMNECKGDCRGWCIQLLKRVYCGCFFEKSYGRSRNLIMAGALSMTVRFKTDNPSMAVKCEKIENYGSQCQLHTQPVITLFLPG